MVVSVISLPKKARSIFKINSTGILSFNFYLPLAADDTINEELSILIVDSIELAVTDSIVVDILNTSIALVAKDSLYRRK